MSLKEIILQQAHKHMSFYIYDEKTIIENIENLKKNFPGVEFLYSVKTNPLPAIVDTVVKKGMWFDAASLGEVEIGHKAGLEKEQIYYSAPGKTKADIAGAVDKAVITADSLHELELLEQVASDRGEKIQIGIRINPDFTFDSRKGSGGKFGIDEEILYADRDKIKALSHLEITGIHVHSRSQELNSAVLGRYYENMLNLCLRVEQAFGIKLQFVNMGGGLGIPYSSEDMPLDVSRLGTETARLMADFKQKLGGIKVLIESGRYIVGKAGTYVTTVVDKKISYGKTYVILNNTLNGFIRPSVAMLVESYAAGVPKASEPLYTKPGAFQFDVLNDKTETEVVTLCGNLCTAADVVAKDVELPKLEIGDVVCISNAGSYGAVLTPFQFASLTPPAQIFLTCDGSIVYQP